MSTLMIPFALLYLIQVLLIGLPLMIFIQLYDGVKMAAKGAIRIILERSESEAEAFDIFFELFDKFLKQV